MKKINIYDFEKKWQDKWENKNVYVWDSKKSRKDNFSIDTPPPTVSGSLHMGHVFSYLQIDFIARFQRMQGKNVFFPIGYDTNGLPTEKLIEKTKSIKSKDLTTIEFYKVCDQVVCEFKTKFRNLFRSIGMSIDWNQEYDTMSSKSRVISQMSFIDLLKKGLVYKKYAPCFWDIKDKTVLSQSEIIDKKMEGISYEINLKTVEGLSLTISTTRPEMISACVAVFYHPNDCRYNKIKNSLIILPFLNKTVPILPDNDVEIDKGTGLVMCCTFGDIQDVIWYRKYHFENKTCINQDGKMCNSGFLNGLSVLEARSSIVKTLKEQELILHHEQVVKNIKCSERSGEVLEILPMSQWFIKVLPFKKTLLELNKGCNWYPDYMSSRLAQWINGLNQDWCISRQRKYGIPFPIWFSKIEGEKNKIIMPKLSQLPINPSNDLPEGYERHEVEVDSDVMDTWATSSLTPQINSLYISKNYSIDDQRNTKLFPYDLRPQAHEIIRTWTFGTLTKSYFHNNGLPWHNIMVSGWCKMPDSTKMSKSKGNIIEPNKILSKYGADVVRYWASESKLGTDIIFNEQVFKNGRRLINKLWNAARFYTIQVKQRIDINLHNINSDINEQNIFMEVDKWILSSLHIVVTNTTNLLNRFAYYEARSLTEEFFLQDFCDHYLEIVKKRVYGHDQRKKSSALITIGYVLQTVLKLFAPYIPHVVDEINEQVFISERYISHSNQWPDRKDLYYQKSFIQVGTIIKYILEKIRKHKSLNNLSLNTALNKVTCTGNINISPMVIEDLKNVCNCSEFVIQHVVQLDNGLFEIDIN